MNQINQAGLSGNSGSGRMMEPKSSRLFNEISNRKEFWRFVDALAADHQVIVDRPKGSRHPRYSELIYPLDYGYLEGTSSMDGGGIDVWIGSDRTQTPGAIIFSIDLKKNDLEIKLLLGCKDEEIQIIMDFMNTHAMRAMLYKRGWDQRELLRSRHSIRRFTDQAVSTDLIQQVLEAATWAPSSHNRQPWRIAVLTSQEAKERLAQAMGNDFEIDLTKDGLEPAEIRAQVKRSRDRISQAPVCMVLCLDPSLGDHYPDSERNQAEHLMGVQSVAMAGQNLMLAASVLGLGSVWMCAPLFTPETVIKTLEIPSHWQPQGMILLGYPAKGPAYRPRLPVDQIALFL